MTTTSVEKCPKCRGRGYVEHSFREWADDITPVLSSIKVVCKACKTPQDDMKTDARVITR